ncbi:MFS transporter [Rhizobium leguminosarum bv. trifolii]|uniref:MFS transporter n=1 Tax=Rhizobium leguminosarum bv. trifolii TaxID=386 RepID=A0A3E1BUI9_RHILT|nr:MULTISPECIES: MFS transporter [Rhizobium]ANM09791.1 major facilitator superfamily protein [Rhizobium sp. N324]ANM16261.1 major facilitator superfamily protein [Rhizobium sp. N541]ANM22646.1 major facilitator superfamily protein [Rhizobium sp. N941]OYD03360.1 major facilitator superfamily protein [Rhizobium sp. N4311]RFB97086.1 MFS transporter [Rhizobium leguminosarum bv. trifolii]
MPNFHRFRSAQTVSVLAVTQLIGWGTTFDMLGVMGRIVAPALGLANEVVFAGLTIMMMISAMLGPATGRWLARYGAARVLSASSLTFALGLSLLAAANGVLLYATAWVVIGIGGAFGLSAPAYTAVVEREGANGKRVIAILMLFTGLSSTIFWPILSLLNETVGWRVTFLISAGLQFFICLPLHLFALPKPIVTHVEGAALDLAPLPLSKVARRKAFLLIAAATTISTFITFGISPSLLEIFRQSGASPAFALQLGSARGLLGISARFLDMLLGRRGNPMLSAAMGIGLMMVSFPIMLVAGSSPPLLVTFVLLYGFGAGVMTVARALLPLAVFSPGEYGLQSARLSLPQNLANAIAPVIFTAILDRAGTGPALIACAILAALSLTFVLMLMAMVRAHTPQPSPAAAQEIGSQVSPS